MAIIPDTRYPTKIMVGMCMPTGTSSNPFHDTALKQIVEVYTNSTSMIINTPADQFII